MALIEIAEDDTYLIAQAIGTMVEHMEHSIQEFGPEFAPVFEDGKRTWQKVLDDFNDACDKAFE